MSTYRLVVQRHQKLLGHFESSTPWASEAIEDLIARLPVSEGFELQLLVAKEERRLIESSSAGIRVLGCEPIFTSLPLKG
ncbi:cytoplasmic protein [Pseudomonas putida]|uniref:cytoplasmic protein n=1 Tax=Pseudomonas putida TaxID=303 RepID=UPI002DC0402B|nr:cytoplasmic protein [Pseudomonas putida]WRW04784.1 cytoplasmic protein [Pseudomonas putida]